MQTENKVDLNFEAHTSALSERVFVDLCKKQKVSVMLDVGANIGQFGFKMRELGYEELIISYEPQLECRGTLASNVLPDPNWIALPNMGAGSTHSQLTLNITANNFSSSFYETHDNHLRAEPLTKAVRKELAPVLPLHASLPSGIAKRVGALKIDTQGYEMEVLKGLGDAFPFLSVIQVELSAVECYVGAPSMEEVEDYIQNTLGFKRVMLAPGYYDPNTNEVQQYDGVYVREDVQPVAKHQGVVIDTVVTSIAKPYFRPDEFGRDWGSNWFNSCSSSWRRFAPNVLSISEVPTQLEGIRWLETKNKPRMIEFLQLAEASSQEQVILTNADVLLSDSLKDALSILDPDVFYYGNRLDVKVDINDAQNLAPIEYFLWGFDFFILPKACLARINKEKLIPAHLRIGEPWWDYALPLLVMHIGHPAKKLVLDPPAALHFHHENTSTKWWVDQGVQFLKWCNTLKSTGKSPIAGLLNELEPLIVKSRTNPEKQLQEASKLIVKWMA